MDLLEVEFLVEKEFVIVVLNFVLDKIYLIGVSDRFCIFNLKFKKKKIIIYCIKIKILELSCNFRL